MAFYGFAQSWEITASPLKTPPLHLSRSRFVFSCWKWPFSVSKLGQEHSDFVYLSSLLLFWGFTLLRRTSDDDECETGVCAEECLNTPGSFRCFCDGRQGMKLSQDLRSCKVNYTNSRKYNTNN